MPDRRFEKPATRQTNRLEDPDEGFENVIDAVSNIRERREKRKKKEMKEDIGVIESLMRRLQALGGGK